MKALANKLMTAIAILAAMFLWWIFDGEIE
jgi:hypothetical protein